MKIIVIGCTHAGTAAVQEIMARNPQAEVTVFERRNDISFLSCGIYLYLEGVVDSLRKVFYATAQDLEKLGPNVHVHMRSDVTAIHTDLKVVDVQDLTTGQKYSEPYDKIILTTGSYPIVPTVKGVTTKNVYLCKTYDDAIRIKDATLDVKRIALVGGGYIGTELSEALSRRGYEVTLVNGRKHILGHYVDGDVAKKIHDDLIANGVDVHDDEVVQRFEPEGQGVYMHTNRGELHVDMAICCVGFSPMTELVKNLVDMTPQGAVKVNDYMQTSDPDIFAAGDSAAVHFNPTHTQVYAPLATNAVRMGKIAAANVLHYGTLRYMGTQSTSALRIFDKTMATSGLTYEKAHKFYPDEADFVHVVDNYRPEFMPSTEKIYMTLVYNRKTRAIMGAQFYSKYDISMCANLISVMIQNKNTVDDLAYVDMLFNPSYDRPWNYMNILGLAAVNKLQGASEQ